MLEASKREAELHARFASLQRFRKGWAGSEWFTPSPELMTLIAEDAVPPSVRGLPSTFMKAIHGAKAKNDKIDAHKIAVLLRGGMLSMAYVYPRAMRGRGGSASRHGLARSLLPAAT